MKNQSFPNVYTTLFGVGECQVSGSDYEAFEATKKLLYQLSEAENSSMAVFDMNKGNYAFVRSKFDAHLNYPFNDQLKNEPQSFFALMPPPDISFTLDTVKKAFSFLNQLNKKDLKEYKLIFEFRLSDPAGNLYRFVQQCVVLEQDNAGNIWLVLILNDLIPCKSLESQLLRKLVHMPSGKIVLFKNETLQSSGKFLSKRETEILGLLSQGLQSKEISERLFISINTVNNHRQKIIEKLNSENTYEALSLAKTLGII